VFPLVEGDLEVEGLEDLALFLHGRLREGSGEVRDPIEPVDQLLVLFFLTLDADPVQRLLERLLLAAELRDPLGDQLRLDSLLEGDDLGLDLAVELGEPQVTQCLRRFESEVPPKMARTEFELGSLDACWARPYFELGLLERMVERVDRPVGREAEPVRKVAGMGQHAERHPA
jgi:hypothetical protein